MYIHKKKKNKQSIIDYMDNIEYDEWKDNQVAYWRKANQIHKWFVDNVQDGVDDCNYYLVSKENIQGLLTLCKTLLEEIKTDKGKVYCGSKLVDGNWVEEYKDGIVITNPEICEDMLPTESGFFFGSTEYDEYYLQDIKNTIEQLDNILHTTHFDKEELYYHSSW